MHSCRSQLSVSYVYRSISPIVIRTPSASPRSGSIDYKQKYKELQLKYIKLEELFQVQHNHYINQQNKFINLEVSKVNTLFRTDQNSMDLKDQHWNTSTLRRDSEYKQRINDFNSQLTTYNEESIKQIHQINNLNLTIRLLNDKIAKQSDEINQLKTQLDHQRNDNDQIQALNQEISQLQLKYAQECQNSQKVQELLSLIVLYNVEIQSLRYSIEHKDQINAELRAKLLAVHSR